MTKYLKLRNKIRNIEKELFETLDTVEVAMNSDNNEFRKMITNLVNKGNTTEDKMIMQMLGILSMKTKDVL